MSCWPGRSPIEGENSEKIFHKILYDPLNLEPLQEAAVAPAVIDLVRKCMAKPPAERPRGFGIVCGAIEETLRARCVAASSGASGSRG